MKSILFKHSFPKSSKKIDVVNPATGKVIASLPEFGIAQVKELINKSASAFDVWRKTSAWERSKILMQWHKLILENKTELAKIINAENGKLMEEAIAEINYAASFIEWSAEEAKRVNGDIIQMPNSNRGLISKQPTGVVAAITPWNFPAGMITRKVAPALAVGCTVICKPSESTPLTAIALQNLAKQAGMPDGVFELVVGDAQSIGKELTSNPKIKKLSFTGSTEVGKLLMAQCAPTVKKVTMELGGNAPFIIFNDADLDKAVDGAIKSRFRNSGQTCICANRFLVQEKIHDEFVKMLTAGVKKLKLAPLIDSNAVKKVDSLVKKSGGKIICGGKSKGNFYEPTIISGLKKSSPIFGAEIFGPVATIFKFKTTEEAIQLAHDTDAGLAAYIYSNDLKKAWHVADEIEFGMIGINEIAIGAAHSPFGGFNHSGIGREGSHFGVEEFLEVKFISIAN